MINLQHVHQNYLQNGVDLEVLRAVSLEIQRGEFVCLLGPSGCGKSTLLRLLAGFERPFSGMISINGIPVSAPSARYLTIFQHHNLLPWRTVQKNVELGLESRKDLKAAERHRRSAHYLEMVGLKDFSKSYPHQLSGGMQQRVAFAGALCLEPEVLFLDEPFGALDAMTRLEMQTQLLEIQKQTDKTIVFVTHDIEEAVYLADRVVIMTPHPGQIRRVLSVQLPAPRDRTSKEFWEIRDEIFREFEFKPKDKTEYYI